MRYRYRTIKEIPDELKPREKLLRNGPESLSEEELLAVILGTGSRDRDVVSLARDIVRIGWKTLEGMSVSELMNVKGMGKVKALQIKALLALARRIREPYPRVVVLTPDSAYDFLRERFDPRRESLVALYLDLSHRVLEVETVAVGSVNRVFVQPREILRPALELSAYGVLIAHNHPQGEPEPSQEDIAFTKRLHRACELMGFELVDHLIVGREDYVSLRELGIL